MAGGGRAGPVIGLAVCTVVQDVLAWPSVVVAEGRKTAWRFGREFFEDRLRNQFLSFEVAEVADQGGLVSGAAPPHPDGRALRLHRVLVNRTLRIEVRMIRHSKLFQVTLQTLKFVSFELADPSFNSELALHGQVLVLVGGDHHEGVVLLPIVLDVTYNEQFIRNRLLIKGFVMKIITGTISNQAKLTISDY